MKKSLHFRRCHVCGHISAKPSSPVNKCEKCTKPLAPFYYFDDRFTAIVGDGTLRPTLVEGEVQPILGLTAYWDS